MIAKSSKLGQFVTFRIEDLWLGIEVLKVQEVIRSLEMTVVPLAPESVEGLINLRGQIVIAIDTRRSLGLAAATEDTGSMNIVIQSSDGAVSLLVDEIHDIISVRLDTYAPVPDNMPAEQRSLIQGVYDLEEGLLLALDTERVLEKASHANLSFRPEAASSHANSYSSQARM